jgi:hypothetical protein
MSPPNLPYNDINLIYIDYNGMGCPKNKVMVFFQSDLSFNDVNLDSFSIMLGKARGGDLQIGY